MALQLHPDKAASACRVATRCCGCGSVAFETVAAQERMQERATWLFKLLGGWVGGRAAARLSLECAVWMFAACCRLSLEICCMLCMLH
jgi:hypothetical protein